MNFKSNYRNKKYDYIENDDNCDFLKPFFEQSYRILKNNSSIYCFCSWHNVDIFKKEFEKYFNLKNILIWEKNNTGMGDLKGSYAPKYEMILFGNKGQRELENFRYSDIIKCNKTNNLLHPTQKPVALIEKLINNSSKKNDIVLDAFGGSGTTAVACYNTHRKYIVIEKNKEYYKTSVERLEDIKAQISLFNL